MKKQTAIDWLIDQLEKYELYSKISFQCLKEIEQAKEMHKQEIIDARDNGVCEGIDIGSLNVDSYPDIIGYKTITEDISKNHEQYYNETFVKI